MSSWLGGSKQIAVGRVVRYRTNVQHEQDGHVFAADSFCFATRAATGELVLFFFQEGLEHGDIGRALWLPAEYGLCGVEPGVLDPSLRNMGMVNEIVRQSDARVLGEIRQEVARARQESGEREESIEEALGREVGKDLDRSTSSEPSDLGSGEMTGKFQGNGVEGKWEVLEAYSAPVKAEPVKTASGKKSRKPAKKKRSKK